MREFLNDIQGTFDSGIYSTALASALLVPDACGAIEHPDERNGVRYSKWFDSFVGGYKNQRFTFDGAVVWKLRNGMIHETILELTPFGYDRVFFTVPDSRRPLLKIHMCTTDQGGETMLNLDLGTFLTDVITGAQDWLRSIESDHEKSTRLDRLIQFRPLGLAPHIVGVPLIA